MSNQDDDSYDGEDDGEGEGSDSSNSKSCGSREPIKDFEQAQMGGLVMSTEDLMRMADQLASMGS